jgi:hypothetical protein
MRISHRHDWSNQNVKDWSVNLASRDPFSLQQFHLGDGDIAVETNIGIGLGRAAAQVVITGKNKAARAEGERSQLKR